MENRQTCLRFGRRKTDDTFKAFHQACDANDVQTAGEMLLILEDKLNPHFKRGSVEGNRLRGLLEAQARLWSLRCLSNGDADVVAVGSEDVTAIVCPATSKLSEWLAAWLRGPQSRFAKAAEFSIKG